MAETLKEDSMEPITPSCQPACPDISGASQFISATGALAVAESWLDTLVQTTHGIWWMTDDEGLVAGQRCLSAYSGVSEDSLDGAGWLAVVAPVDRAAITQRWQEQRAITLPATPLEAAWRFIRPRGRVEWLAVRAQPVIMTPGETARWLWIATPTAQERAASAIGLYRALFEQAAQGLVVVGGRGAPVRANMAALSLLGLTVEQLRGEQPPPSGWRVEREDGARMGAPLREIAAIAARERFAQEFWQVRADDWAASRWLTVTASPINRMSAEPQARMLIFLSDATERMRSRLAIQSLAQKSTDELSALRRALDRVTDAFVVLDYAGHFTYVNERAREQFAPTGETLIGRRFWQVFPALAGSAIQEEFRRIVRERTQGVIEAQVGDGVWLEVRSYPASDGISVYIRDISGQKRMLADLDNALRCERESRAEAEDRAQQLDAVFEAVSDGMVVFGPDGAALRANQAMRNLLAGLGETLPLPMPAAEFNAILARNEPNAVEGATLNGAPLRRILRGESLTGDRTVDIVLRTPREHDLHVNISGAPIRGGDGAIQGAVESLRDVTAHREAELERSKTLSVVAHELRTPLTAIKLSLDLSLRRVRRNLSIEPDALEVAISSCLQLERMVNDLVDAARAERKNMVTALACCDAGKLAMQAVAEQQTTTEKPIIVATPKTPTPILADATRLRQVLSNLLSNAVKYSPPDTGVTLQVETRDNCVWVGVSDEGPGVPAEAIPRLFDAFYRAPNVVSQTGPNVGLGLGLYLCKRIIDLHGGQIGMQNRPEGGSLFWFTIPLAKGRPTQ